MRSTTKPRGQTVFPSRGLLLAVLLATCTVAGCAPKVPASGSPTVDETLSYAVASKSIKDHIGKRVAWQGMQVTYNR